MVEPRRQRHHRASDRMGRTKEEQKNEDDDWTMQMTVTPWVMARGKCATVGGKDKGYHSIVTPRGKQTGKDEYLESKREEGEITLKYGHGEWA